MALVTVLFALTFGTLPLQAGSRTVVVSILPIHGLVAGLVGDLHEVAVLLPASASPHGYAMRPSDARRLQDADLLVWVGPDLETFLGRPLAEQRAGRTVVTLMEDTDLDLLPGREGGVWETHDHGDHGDHGDAHGHGHDHSDSHRHDGHHSHDHADSPGQDHKDSHDHGHHADGGRDPHIWLSPAVARQIVEGMTEHLARWDPANAEAFQHNRDHLIERIDALDTELARQLEPVRDRPFIVFHDAYQYFERHYGLNAAGSITLDPSLAPGARRVQELRNRLQQDDVACLFTEPQFRPALAESLVDGLRTRIGELDPVGSSIEPGPDSWFSLMRNLSGSLSSCLAPHEG